MEKLKNLLRWSRWKPRLKKAISFLLNPRLLLCFGIAWFFTNGWSYVAVLVGTWLKLNWLVAVGSAYLALLWFPFTPEKIFTVVIAIWLLKLLFPNDKNTLAVLQEMRASFRKKHNKTDAEQPLGEASEDQGEQEHGE